MRPNLRLACRVAFLILSVISVTSLRARLSPIFSLDGCAWFATHIALVQTTARDGVFTVVEPLKGDLKQGDSLNIPELKPDKNAVPISAYPKGREIYAQGMSEMSDRIPRQPVGSQLILFLRKQQESGDGTAVKWVPVSEWAGMRLSALWIDEGKAFCFQQAEYPGPSALTPCVRLLGESPETAVVVGRIRKVLATQRELARVFKITNENWRAQRLGQIAMGDVAEAQTEAIDALGKSGAPALPEILQFMDKPPTRFYDGEALIRVFVEAAGKDSGRQLHARLQEDVIYWKTIGPTLTREWLGQLVVVGSPLFMKFNETRLLVQELDQERYAPAAQTVAELRDFWVSQAQLYDSKWGKDGRNGEVRTSVSGEDIVRAQAFWLADWCSAFLRHVAGDQNQP